MKHITDEELDRIEEQWSPPEHTDLSVEQLIARGYRRTSNKHRMLSRIDRPDWWEVLTEHLHRIPPGPRSQWPDFYRRVLSNDTVIALAYVARQVPTSGHDPVEYVEDLPPMPRDFNDRKPEED